MLSVDDVRDDLSGTCIGAESSSKNGLGQVQREGCGKYSAQCTTSRETTECGI